MLSPYAKAALFCIRFAACGLMILGFALYATDFYLYVSHRPISRPAVLALKSVPVLASVALYGKSKGMAIYLTKDLD
jgi:hypothetical protein